MRLLLALLPLGAFLPVVVSTGSAAPARKDLCGVLPIVVALFAFIATISLAILRNSVFGLQDKTMEQARRVRALARSAYDELAEGASLPIRSLVGEHIEPLLRVSLREIHHRRRYSDWSKGLER